MKEQHRGEKLPEALMGITGLILWFAVVQWIQKYQVPYFHCLWREWTGLPCPGCGASRCALQISKGHFVDALLLNPLAFILYGGIACWFMIWVVAQGFLRREIPKPLDWIQKYPWVRWSVIGAILVNWIYLLWCRPN